MSVSVVQEHEEENPHAISKINAIFMLVNAIAGSGVLNFPEVYKFGGGFIFPNFFLVVFASLTLWGLVTLCLIGIANHCETLQDLLLYTCGVIFASICSFILIFYGLGSCTTYLIVIGDQLDRVLYSAVGPKFCNNWYLRREFTVTVFGTMIILPNIYSKKVDFLTIASKIGVVGIFYNLIMIIVLYFVGNYEAGHYIYKPEDWNKVTYLIPTFIFAFHCHAQAMPIISCLRKRSPYNVIQVTCLSFCICFLFFAAAGICGYATFGDDVMANIVLNYNAGDPIVSIGLILLSIKICCVYPIVLFCGRVAFIDLLSFVFKLDKPKHEFKLRIIVATCFHILALLLAMSVPNIGLAIGFMGVFCALFVFFVPGMSQIMTGVKDPESKWARRNRILGIILVVFGIALALLVFTQAVRRIVTSYKDGVQKLCTPD